MNTWAMLDTARRIVDRERRHDRLEVVALKYVSWQRWWSGTELGEYPYALGIALREVTS